MDEQYQPQKIETAARQSWEKKQAFRVREDAAGEKYYCLCMFP